MLGQLGLQNADTDPYAYQNAQGTLVGQASLANSAGNICGQPYLGEQGSSPWITTTIPNTSTVASGFPQIVLSPFVRAGDFVWLGPTGVTPIKVLPDPEPQPEREDPAKQTERMILL